MIFFTKQKFNDKCEGFYTPDIHETLFKKEGDEYIPTFSPYIKLEQETYMSMLEEVNSNPLAEFRFDSLGKLIVFKKKPLQGKFILPDYDYDKDEWIETCSDECLFSEYTNIIDKLKQEILQEGMLFTKNQEKYRQRCRTKDTTLLASKIQALELMKSNSCIWYVDDIPLELTLDDLKNLFKNGDKFYQSVYYVEHELKNKKPNLNITLDMYKDMVDNVSEVKCFR